MGRMMDSFLFFPNDLPLMDRIIFATTGRCQKALEKQLEGLHVRWSQGSFNTENWIMAQVFPQIVGSCVG